MSLLGSFSPTLSSNMQQFNFAAATTQYVHMRILDDWGNNDRVGFAEAAFVGEGVTPVPAPSGGVLLAAAAVCFASYSGLRRRKQLLTT
jgi:hypothetical protein